MNNNCRDDRPHNRKREKNMTERGKDGKRGKESITRRGDNK